MATASRTEALFISAVLNSANYSVALGSGVTSSWFHHYAVEWEWVTSYARAHRSTPSVDVFGAEYPDFKIYSADDPTGLVEPLKASHVRMSLLGLARDISADPNNGAPLKQLVEVKDRLSTISADVLGLSQEAEMIGEWASVFDEAKARFGRASDTGLAGIPTGFPTYDDSSGGIQPSELVVLAARLNQGKTFLLLWMALNAIMEGYSVQFNSLEQSKEQIMFRAHPMLHFLTENTESPFTVGQLNTGKGLDLRKYKGFLKNLPKQVPGDLIINDTGRRAVQRDPIGTLAAQIERNNPDIVMIDYLTLMSPTHDWKDVSMLSAGLKELTTTYHIPIVANAQIKRLSQEEKGLPRAEHLALADAIGQDADSVITFHRKSERVVEMYMAKHRNAQGQRKWYLEFDINVGVIQEVNANVADDIKDEDDAAKG